MRINKTTVILAACMMIGLCLLARADDDTVTPQKLDGIKLYRGGTEVALTTNTVFTQGATILFTNLQVFATSDLGTNSVVQGLSNVTAQIAMSSSLSSTGTWVEATAQDVTNGTLYCSYPAFPEAGNAYWQLRLVDGTTNDYYYIIGKLLGQDHL